MRPVRSDASVELLPAIMPTHHLRSTKTSSPARGGWRVPQLPFLQKEVPGFEKQHVIYLQDPMAKTAYEPRGRAVRRFPGAGRTPRGGRPEVQAPAVMSAREVRAIPVGPEFITSITFGMEVSPRARSESLGATNASQATLRLTSSVERGAMARSARSVRSRSPSNSQSLSPSPRHHFLRKGAGLVSQRLVAQQNRQRFGRASHSQDDEDRSASRPPLPFASDLASPAHQVVQVRRNSLRRPSVPVTIDLGLVEDGQSLSLSLQRTPTTTRDVGPSPPSFVDEPRSSLGSEETAPQEEEVKVQEWVKEPEKRGMNAYQFEVFFAKFCGDVIYEELEEPPKPLCLPTTLCQLCVQANRQDPQVRARTKRPRETNLYAVTELIIKPETCKEGVSYSELINPRGLQVDYFISHHWAEDFGEFVQSVLRHAIIAAPELGGKWKDVVYWCCAFANNQHQIELGETLQKSPFYQALNSKNCKGTVMNLNQAATALDRIWCIYEVYLTHSLEKPFTLNFRLGPLVGVVQETKEKDSWVFHIFKMLQHIDVGQADATNPDDYNKIMGEIENFRSREGTGPKALNRIVKAMLGSQAIFTLARRGDLQAVKRALELDADPNIPDTLGIRPLTYAAGNGHEEVCHALIAGSADVRAQVGALEVLGMFSPQRGERRRCIEHVRVLDEERTEGFHSAAISKALLQHTTSRCQDLTSALDADNAELRLEVVRELRLLLHALVDHSMKLLQGGQAGAGEDERQAISKHSQSLAPYLADPDARVRLAVVEAVTSIGNFDLHTLKVPKSIIQEDNLHAIVDEDMGQNIVHFAASQTCPNALYMLATGVDWAVEPRALRAEDAEGRNVAHLAVEKGHMECLAMMVGDKKLPRAALTHQDHLGRTPVHYAALRGDAATLRAFADLGNLTTAELSVGDNSGSWPQHVAAARGYGRFLGVLVNDCAFPEDLLSQPDGDGRTVAHLAVARGDQDVNLLRYLVETCRMPKSVLHIADTWHRTPAHDAAFADAPEMLSLLQDYGAPLHMPMGPGEPQIGAVAIVNQSSEVVAYLGNSYRIGRVHYVDRHQKMRFEYEKGTKDLETVEVERCELAPTPLVLAEKLGRKKAQQFLSNAWEPIANLSGISKEDIMSQARRGALPAGVLVSQGALSAVQKFLEKGYLSAADLSKRDAMGCSCLHRAASTGVPEAVCAVVELGKFQAEDFLAADAQGWTVLHHAARSGKGACVEVVLLQCHLPQEALGAPDLWGRSPVHLAADADATEVLQALAKHLAPMHATMGRPVLEDGLITLVQPREMYGLSTGRSRGNIPEVRKGTSFAHIKSLGGSSQVVDEDSEDEGLFSVGRVIQVFNNHQVHIKHESGFREGYVELERCTFSPTPIVLAERRGRFQAVQTLIEVAWKPFVDSVASFAMSQNWEWEDLEEDMRSEALRGALPVGALVATKSEELPWLLKELIQAEVIAAEDLLLQDMRGRSALHRAAASGQADVLFAVKELARASNEHLEISDIQGHNLLHHAVLSGDGDTVRLAARMLPMRTPEELAAGDMWHLTPVHLAATINSLEAIKALMELGLPVDKPSGPTKFDIGAVVLVQPKKIDLREGDQDQEAHPWQLGMVRAVTGNDLTVKFPHGGKETKGIAFERCEVAPTPQVLAEKLLKHDVALKLREVNDAFNNTLRKKLGASGGSKFAQAAQAASGASGVVSLMRHSKVVGMEKEGPKLKLDGPKLGRAKSNEAPSSPKNGPKRPREKAAAAPASTARRRFRGAAMSVVANLRLARPS